MSQSLEELQQIVRRAGESDKPLSIKGRGTWTSAYRHASAASELSLWNYAGVQEYVPGNLTMTVRAGTTLREIAEIAGAENQWLPLDPYGDAAGTIGATIATCSYGPLVTGFGTPRDLVLGVEAVLGNSEVVRGGGRVVKNVAGYDLSRLLTGSWGTIGAITEVTLRLFAKQESEASIALALPDKREAAVELLKGIRSAPLYPWAMDMVDPKVFPQIESGAAQLLVFRFGGNQKVVASQIQTIQSLGKSWIMNADHWQMMNLLPHQWSMRLSGLPSSIFKTWEAAGRLIAEAEGGFRIATPERGMVRMFFPAEISAAKLFTRVGTFAKSGQAAGLRVVIEAMPSASPLTVIGDNITAINQLSNGIKKVFDSRNILNPGFLQQ